MKDKKLPAFGPGPIYVIGCLILTIFGIYLDKKGLLYFAKVDNFRYIFIGLGILLIIFGIVLWVLAVFKFRINFMAQNNILIKDGVYAYVRNPVYSAFLFVFTGILLLRANFLLLIFPIIFYFYMTFLLINTEEKWLYEVFGEEYLEYKKKVNRIIPWKRKNEWLISLTFL